MTLPADRLLDMLEQGAGLSANGRALLLLETSGEMDGYVFSIGQREAALLRLRKRLLGSRIDARAECPHCRADVETELRVDGLLAADRGTGERTISIERDGWTIRVRLPDGGDLAAIEAEGLGPDSRSRLVARCLIEATHEAAGDAPLPDAIVIAIEAAFEDADPLADIALALVCPQCGEGWSSRFDAGVWLWRELEAWGERLIHAVHRLAAVYGWGEADILALSPSRRARYLDLLGA